MVETFVRHTAEEFAKYDLAELRQKRFLANMCIQAAREAQAEGDPRAERALAHYRAERATINEALQRRLYGEAGPPAQAVGLKTLSMAGHARRDREDKVRPGVANIEEFLRLFVGGNNGGR